MIFQDLMASTEGRLSIIHNRENRTLHVYIALAAVAVSFPYWSIWFIRYVILMRIGEYWFS